MLEGLKALAERSVMERVVLLVNHVIAAEPAAVARLMPHAGRTVQIELAGWPQLLPAVGPFAFRITPAGLVEWLADSAGATPDLRVAFDAANPALAFTRVVAGERPQVVVSGDAAFATDVDWLIDNLRWDVQDDLARFVGAGPAEQVGRLARAAAAGVREAVRTLGALVGRDGGSTGAPGRPPP